MRATKVVRRLEIIKVIFVQSPQEDWFWSTLEDCHVEDKHFPWCFSDPNNDATSRYVVS